MTPGFPERCPVPVRSAVIPPCGRLAMIRVTHAGGLMQITKLRTVTVQNPNSEWTVSHDQCTSVSRLLRSTHLVLPRLLNVIRGQMPLVGPRPERPHFTLRES